jgi:adenosylcobyric acid synthase
MAARSLMVQGTASNVGKSLLVTALCRYFHRKGVKVAPFKSQNMALNSFVTSEGLEIGRAQAEQAFACGIDPHVDVNPVLLKCESDHRVQVVVEGRVMASMTGEEYYGYSQNLRPVIEASLQRLMEKYELVLLEGAGSPAEVNLQERDLANMFPAKLAQAPVLLVGDIDRGGVFASLLGTLELLPPSDRARVKGLVINKFRGNLDILKTGLSFLEQRTGLPVLGVLPYLSGLGLASEDSVALEESDPFNGMDLLDIAILRFPHLSNFDDFLPLAKAEGVRVRYVSTPGEVEGSDLVILPGTKTTVADLRWLREAGFEPLLRKRAEENRPLLGVCGGYQMLGERIEDPSQVESKEIFVKGLGLLPITTRFGKEKTTTQVEASTMGQGPLGPGAGKVSAYEIHMGQVAVSGKAEPMFRVSSRNGRAVEETEGAVSGSVAGTLLHGLFENEAVRSGLLGGLARLKGLKLELTPYSKEKEYDRLADMVRQYLDTSLLEKIVEGKA